MSKSLPAFLQIYLPTLEDVKQAQYRVTQANGAVVVTRVRTGADERGWSLVVFKAGTTQAAPTLAFSANDPARAAEIVVEYLDGKHDVAISEAADGN